MPVAQFYHINVDNEFPYNVYGGMQDNGSWRGPAYVWKAQGIRNSYWQEISFGDGFDVIPDRDDSRYGWTMSQQGYVSRYDWQTGNNYGVQPTHPDAEVLLRFNWNAAINIDPFKNNTIYFGSQFVHKSDDKGDTWKIISPDLTTNNPEKLKQRDSGGLTIDATGAENHCTILVIEPSPIEKDMLWIGTDDGRIHITQNGGKTWSDVSKNLKGLPEGSWIVQIKASNKNKGEALLVANDYRRFNYEPYAYRTKNYGKSWERILDSKDVKSYTLSIIEDLEEPNLLFLGTDDGLYVSTNAGQKWTKWTEGFPTVPVKDLVIHPREHDLVIGTFGRAAWVLDDLRPLRAIAKNEVTNTKLELFSPPTAYKAAYQQATGSRFGGDAMYSGDNRSSGARFKYFIKVEKALDDEKKNDKNEAESDEETEKDSLKQAKVKWDSITMKIYDNDKLIRTLKRKTPDSTGIYNWTWYMREKGVDYPSKTIRKNTNEPGGVMVKPGTYKAVMHYGDLTSEEQITVKEDPRITVFKTNTDAVYSALKEIEDIRQTMADATKQLAESKTIAQKYNKNLTTLGKEKYKDEIKASKAIIKKIDTLFVIYFGKVDERQGITRSNLPTVNSRISKASNYIRSRKNGITNTETTLLNHAKTALNNALLETNAFFEKAWKTYKVKIESINLSEFKKIKTF
jgi:hypothetical protein